jgi:hypothetical protein
MSGIAKKIREQELKRRRVDFYMTESQYNEVVKTLNGEITMSALIRYLLWLYVKARQAEGAEDK